MEKSISKLKKELDKWFSLYIRLRNSSLDGVTHCFTCGKIDYYKKMQCGHFQSRKHLATRFDTKNCQVQCAGCNVFRYGEQFKFALALDSQYGDGTAEELLILSKQSVKISRHEYKDYISYYKHIVKNLKEDRCID